MKQRTFYLLFIAFLLIPCSTWAADWTWQVMLQPGTTLYGVWGGSGSDVFAVGANGTILHYDGTSWSTMSSGTTAQLNGVWGSSESDVFAVGNSGTIVHYDGSTWSAMTSGTPVQLNGVWGSSGSDVFAVGGYYSGFFAYRTICHYDGASWSAETTMFYPPLNGVWGSSGSDVFAVGDGSYIVHYDGSTWSAMILATDNLNGVWGSPEVDVFAIGDTGTILHYNGSDWPAMASGTTRQLNGVWGSPGSNVFAVGDHVILYYGEATLPPTTSTTTTSAPPVTTTTTVVTTTSTVLTTSTTTTIEPNLPCDECTDAENLSRPFAGGDGSAGNPYIICTADQLNNVRTHLDKHFIVKADIDLSDYTNWEPIGPGDFTGVFDGNHFTISNLTVNRPADQYIGLFGNVGYPSGIVKNIDLQNAQVTGGTFVGALAGSCNSMIIGCSSSGRVVGLGDYSDAGGLVGSVLGNYMAFSISQSYSTCEVISDQKAGGLVGLVGGGDALITNCYATGAVAGNYSAGGLIGTAITGSMFGMSVKVNNCYSTGRITLASKKGGLIGDAGTVDFTVSNSYWDTQTSGMTTSNGGEGKTTEQMKQQATYTDWDFTTIWEIDEGISYPGLLLTEQPASCTPTLIELTDFAAQPFNGKVIITWQTESEIDNAGFNLYRTDAEDGDYIKINAALIPASGSATQGAAYEFVDTDVKNRKTYWYKLEDINLQGVSTLHGPIKATPKIIYSLFQKQVTNHETRVPKKHRPVSAVPRWIYGTGR